MKFKTGFLQETRGRTGLVVRALDSGSGDPGSVLTQVGGVVSLSKRHLLMTYFMARSNLLLWLFYLKSDNIAACDMEVGRWRQLIECIKLCE